MKDKIVFRRSEIVCTLFAIILISFFIHGCAGTSDHRRGKLSDAVDKASDKNKKSRVVETEPDPEPEDEDIYEEPGEGYIEPMEYTVNAEGDTVAVSSVDDMQFGRMWFAVSGGTGLVKGNDYTGLNHFNLSVCGYMGQHNRFELAAGMGWTPVSKTSYLQNSISGGLMLFNIGLNYKYYTTRQHTLMGMYFLFGGAYNYMRWSYKNGILADAYDEFGNYTGTELITSDGLSGLEFYTGIGLNLLQSETFQLGAEVTPGVIFWGWDTTEGFANDIFSTFLYGKLKFFISFKGN